MTDKVEQYIQKYTKNCSNETRITIGKVSHWEKHPWLTPDQARAVAEIAKEEMIEKSAEWTKLYILNHDIIDIFEMETEYKKYMEESV